MENLNLAFDVAEKHLDIPRMLDPEGRQFQSSMIVKGNFFWINVEACLHFFLGIVLIAFGGDGKKLFFSL